MDGICPFALKTLSLLCVCLNLSLFAQPPSEQYQLVLEDQFDDGKLAAHWWPAGVSECTTQGFNACECDMWYKPAHVMEEDSMLVLLTTADSVRCGGVLKPFTSGAVQTAGTYLYGYYEIRAKIPKGNGMWPAFWLFSKDAEDYNEIDIFEFCGCKGSRFQAGFFWDVIDNDSIDAGELEHEYDNINVGNDGCENFNTYGVEWRKDSIKIYVNGELKSALLNDDRIHLPMQVFLNNAVNGCWKGCGWTVSSAPFRIDTRGNCHVSLSTNFPQRFEIDYFKMWQKKDEAIFLKGPDTLFIGQQNIPKLKAPHYPDARYTWTSSSPEGLKILPMNYVYDGEGGLWKAASLIPKEQGNYQIELLVEWVNGYAESKIFEVIVKGK
ncbi:MAG: glycoside hydrolase family 16 protein [Bacteroidota bacterium]